MLTNFYRDLRFALRQLRKSPGFAFTAVLTLALGIGANTAIFSLFLQVLFHTLPIQDPQSVVLLRATGATTGHTATHGDSTYYFDVPMFHNLANQAQPFFSQMAASGPFSAPVSAPSGTEDAQGELVTGEYFSAFGVQPVLGRLLQPSDDMLHNGNPVVVLSYAAWQQRFAGSSAALNQVVDINAHPFTVVGVTPRDFPGFNPRDPTAIFIPISMEASVTTHRKSWQDDHGTKWANVVARLQPGMTRKRAEIGLQPVWLSLRKQELGFFKDHSSKFTHGFLQTHLFVEAGAQGLPFLQQQDGTMVSALFGMALLVLLIACVNLANLLLVRGNLRAKEFGVRAALGASRSRLLRAVWMEALVLALLGGGIGIRVGLSATQPLLLTLIGNGVKPAPLSSSLGLHLLLFSATALLLTAFLGCLPSMLLSARTQITGVLHQSGGWPSAGASRMQIAFTTLQIMVSFVLLVGSCLLARSLYNLRNIDIGLHPENIVQFSVDARPSGETPQQVIELSEKIVSALQREPGMTVISYAKYPILAGSENSRDITIAGYTAKAEEEISPELNAVSPAFFTALGVPLLAGRMFTLDDRAGSPKVAIVNESFAQHYLGDSQHALGQKFYFGSNSQAAPEITIVGLVKNFSEINLHGKDKPALFFPFAQDEPRMQGTYFYLQTTSRPDAAFSVIRQVVHNVNPSVRINDVETLNEEVNRFIRVPRLMAGLAISFGILAALLAAIGLYGVLAYSISQRTKEIGIRMALGADRAQVVYLVVEKVGWMICAAIAMGIPLSLLLGHALRSQLFHVADNDPLILLAAALLSILVAAMAAYLPARRAATIDPMRALRNE